MTLQEIKEIAHSLDYFDLEPYEQALVDQIDEITDQGEELYDLAGMVLQLALGEYR